MVELWSTDGRIMVEWWCVAGGVEPHLQAQRAQQRPVSGGSGQAHQVGEGERWAQEPRVLGGSCGGAPAGEVGDQGGA